MLSNQKILFILLLFVFSFSKLCSQKVGLVLSGGGAKGMAHIGVIKALEENNIPIDYITGTSMGAIVGSLYASGYTTDEMVNLIKSDQFKFWSTGKIEEEYQYFFKKHDIDASWLELKFQIEDSTLKPIVPTNIVANHQMDLAFFYLYSQAAAAANYNFDSLMVPFRAIATDVHLNKAVVLKEGQLCSAVRASMTYPFFFKPIKINGTLLFDGGMKNNFPIDVMMEDFNPGFIIGSKVASNSKPPDEDDLYSQLQNMLLGKTDYNIPKGKGILIEPPVKGVELLDFQYVDMLEKNGYDATIAKMDSIKKYIQRRVSANEIIEKRKNFKNKMPEFQFDEIKINGLNSTQIIYATNNLRLKKQIISFPQFKKTYFRLIQDDIIKTIYPTAIYNDTSGYFDLNLDVKRDNKFEANFGGNISSTSYNQAFLGLQYKHLSRKSYNIFANSYFGRFYGSIQLKGRVDFPPEKFAFNKGITPFFVELGVTLNSWDYFKSSNQLFFEDVRPSYLIQREYNVRSDIGIPVKGNAKLIFGAAIAETEDEYYQIEEVLKSDTSDFTYFDYTTFHLTYELNTLNYKQFANKGKYLKVTARYVMGEELYKPGSTSFYRTDIEPERKHSYFQARITNDIYKKISKYYTIGFNLDAIYTSKFYFYNYTSTLLNSPSYQPIPNSKVMFLENYRSYTFGAIGLRNIFHVTEYLDFRMEGFYFQPFQKILADQQIPYYGEELLHQYFMASTGFVYHTLIGPISITANYYEKNNQKFFVLLNFGYTLFNKRAID